MQHVTVGGVQVFALIDDVQAYPATDVYHQAGDALDAYRHYLEPDGGISLNFGCFLLRDADATVLVDTGLGADANGKLLQELDAAGVDPASVDRVVFTHLHGDHTGWNIDPATGKPRFSAARYLVPGADWAYYSKQEEPPASFTRDVVPLQQSGVMELFDGEQTVTPSITAIPTPGHTPGHTSLVVSSQGERGFILGDVVLTPVDAEELTWVNTFDWDSETARATRLRIVDRLVNDGSLVGASHMPAPGLGRFVRTEGRTAWQGFRPGED